MSPARLLILFILLYILYRLVFGGRKKRKAPQAGQGHAAHLQADDVLVEDPVCHTYIPKGQAQVLEKNGETFHFCSEKCRSAFIERRQAD